MGQVPYDIYMIERSRKALNVLSETEAFNDEHEEYVFIMQCALLATSDIFLISDERRQELFEIKSEAQKLLLRASPCCSKPH